MESTYFCAVVRTDPDRPSGRTLLLDDLRNSYVDLDDPTHLEFSYSQIVGDVIEAVAPGTTPVRAAHIGGGGFTMPRYLAATRPGSTSVVFELDPSVVELAEDRLGLVLSPELRAVTGDARVLRDLATGSIDLVIGDAFGGEAVPWHLTTREFVEEIHDVLAPGGVCMYPQPDRPRWSRLRSRRGGHPARRVRTRGRDRPARPAAGRHERRQLRRFQRRTSCRWRRSPPATPAGVTTTRSGRPMPTSAGSSITPSCSPTSTHPSISSSRQPAESRSPRSAAARSTSAPSADGRAPGLASRRRSPCAVSGGTASSVPARRDATCCSQESALIDDRSGHHRSGATAHAQLPRRDRRDQRVDTCATGCTPPGPVRPSTVPVRAASPLRSAVSGVLDPSRRDERRRHVVRFAACAAASSCAVPSCAAGCPAARVAPRTSAIGVQLRISRQGCAGALSPRRPASYSRSAIGGPAARPRQSVSPCRPGGWPCRQIGKRPTSTRDGSAVVRTTQGRQTCR
ncbi:MAG: fused MFS/spermidine synthase [Ilumatobacteraceae bacterium]